MVEHKLAKFGVVGSSPTFIKLRRASCYSRCTYYKCGDSIMVMCQLNQTEDCGSNPHRLLYKFYSFGITHISSIGFVSYLFISLTEIYEKRKRKSICK